MRKLRSRKLLDSFKVKGESVSRKSLESRAQNRMLTPTSQISLGSVLKLVLGDHLSPELHVLKTETVQAPPAHSQCPDFFLQRLDEARRAGCLEPSKPRCRASCLPLVIFLPSSGVVITNKWVFHESVYQNSARAIPLNSPKDPLHKGHHLPFYT